MQAVSVISPTIRGKKMAALITAKEIKSLSLLPGKIRMGGIKILPPTLILPRKGGGEINFLLL